MAADQTSIALAGKAAQAAAAKGALDIVAFDVSQATSITDIFVVCSGTNSRQINAIVDEVERVLLLEGHKARREGEKEGRWVLLDYEDIIVHVQHEEQRAFYALERLWRDCPAVPLSALTSDHQGSDQHTPSNE